MKPIDYHMHFRNKKFLIEHLADPSFKTTLAILLDSGDKWNVECDIIVGGDMFFTKFLWYRPPYLDDPDAKYGFGFEPIRHRKITESAPFLTADLTYDKNGPYSLVRVEPNKKAAFFPSFFRSKNIIIPGISITYE